MASALATLLIFSNFSYYQASANTLKKSTFTKAGRVITPGINTILNGKGAPKSTLGIDGDFYIDINTMNIYGPKTKGKWPVSVSMKGLAGTNGTNGVAGATGATGAKGTSTNGADGLPGIPGATGASGSSGAGSAGAAGPAGAQGATGPTGPAALTNSAISSNINLTASNRYFVDTSAARTLTLPVSPTQGDEIQIIDSSGTAATNNITINRNSGKINGIADNLSIDLNGAAATLIYTGSTWGWVVR